MRGAQSIYHSCSRVVAFVADANGVREGFKRLHLLAHLQPINHGQNLPRENPRRGVARGSTRVPLFQADGHQKGNQCTQGGETSVYSLSGAGCRYLQELTSYDHNDTTDVPDARALSACTPTFSMAPTARKISMLKGSTREQTSHEK